MCKRKERDHMHVRAPPLQSRAASRCRPDRRTLLQGVSTVNQRGNW